MKKQQQIADFLQMLRQCEGTIFHVCYKFTDRTPEAAADLYQEIVYRLWLHYPDFRGHSAAATWVYRIAMNTACQQLRMRKRAPHFVTFDAEAFKNFAEAEHDELVDLLYQLVDQLPPPDQLLLYLYLDQIPIEQIAKHMQCSTSTVKRKIRQIIQTLKQRNLEDEY
jgi:RNA polymerase sigma-70 factor (ECF subfamily)